jgi:hypothetical protein
VIKIELNMNEHSMLATGQGSGEVSPPCVIYGSDGHPLLPISPDGARIAVIGSCASSSPLVHGQGSGEVSPPYIITLLQVTAN